MKTKVQLRNKTGQFCTFKEFCGEEPVFHFPSRPSFTASENLEKEEQRHIEILRVIEIIKIFGIKESGDNGYTDAINIKKDGSYQVGRLLAYENLQEFSKKRIEKLRELSAKWNSSEYEVEV